jgi:shikimate dehydrogenase
VRFSIANRTAGKAAHIARDFAGSVVSWEERSRALGEVNLLINTSSLGMKGMPSLDIDLARLPLDAIVVDIVYVPLETALLKSARERGLKAMDGLGMLMWQAHSAYVTWLGAEAPVDAKLRDLLETQLRVRE